MNQADDDRSVGLREMKAALEELLRQADRLDEPALAAYLCHALDEVELAARRGGTGPAAD